jgi:cell division septum initiation protein DivIVA
MAPRQTTKAPVNGKKPASRRQLMTPTKAKMNRPGRKPGRKPRAEVEAAAALAAAPAPTSDDGDLTTLLSNLTKQLIVQQQAISTQAWLTKEIDILRQQVGASAPSKTTGRIAAAATNSPELLAEIAQLRQENADLREKAARLDQMASLLGLSDTVAATPAKVKGKPGRPAKNPAAAAAKAVAAPEVKIPGKRGPKPKVKDAAEVRPLVVPMARSSSKASILKAAADRDVARTFKSCWPVVFKIEEWNAKNPARLAKISQTMLNKCGVNFARAKQFVEAHEAIILRYHNDIGLNKANSGKFNEVYEFVRDSLGKGRRN